MKISAIVGCQNSAVCSELLIRERYRCQASRLRSIAWRHLPAKPTAQPAENRRCTCSVLQRGIIMLLHTLRVNHAQSHNVLALIFPLSERNRLIISGISGNWGPFMEMARSPETLGLN